MSRNSSNITTGSYNNAAFIRYMWKQTNKFSNIVKTVKEFIQQLLHVSNSQVLSTRFGFISLRSLTVLILFCVCWIIF